jgi:hypothetical protein
LSVLSAVLIAAAISGSALSARANSNVTGTAGVGPSAGRTMATPMTGPRRVGTPHTHAFVSLHRFRFHRGDVEAFEHARGSRRFHHHGHGNFADGFFPFGFFPGFGWPVAEPDVALADGGDEMSWGMPLFWRPVERYEPPTVEKAPSGVTIIRGPGSHHAWP